MTEEQGNRIIELLESMNSHLDSISSNTNPAYDASDICNRLDDVITAIENNG
ncbi:hypothetical protein DFQ09_11063 [Winogradskyella pacifica]|uniref:Uncharacterized protein n=1 Tax=Winogradskyella pacifica TaxID=664642 RepID=A0A3D9LKF4_9FLAO|nr:hypothetical protein DFQ09_11063 [Winogradskyella pacifica]